MSDTNLCFVKIPWEHLGPNAKQHFIKRTKSGHKLMLNNEAYSVQVFQPQLDFFRLPPIKAAV